VGTLRVVLRFAPRISPRLLEALGRLDDRRVPIAETCRRLGSEAERLKLPRPSYERIRVLIHALRAARRQLRRGPSTASVLLDVALRARPADALLDLMAGIPLPKDPRPP
jgi:hypothetical protein